ncbi:hypothetical protein BD413DRAFT_542630 [Trametes elegans]|nr:hypothetical protein BD413DRAFT_542630 [Trametes elegans]
MEQKGTDVSQLITLAQTAFTVACVEYPVPTFLLYDYLITLDEEIRLFWKRKFTGASVLFLFIRYYTLLSYDVLGVITFAELSDISCVRLTRVQAAFTMLQYIPWAIFSTLRVLALSGLNWALALVVFLLSIAPAAANFTQYGFNLTAVNVPFAGCQAQISATPQQIEILVIVSRASLIIADALGVAATVMATGRRTFATNSSTRTIGDVLLYDGVMYFAALFCFNAVDLALSVIAIVTPYHSGSYVTALTDPLTAVLICRFLLDLQAANVKDIDPDTQVLDSVMDVGTLVFASRVIGSIGASLRPGSATSSESYEDLEDEGGLEQREEGQEMSDCDPCGTASVQGEAPASN